MPDIVNVQETSAVSKPDGLKQMVRDIYNRENPEKAKRLTDEVVDNIVSTYNNDYKQIVQEIYKKENPDKASRLNDDVYSNIGKTYGLDQPESTTTERETSYIPEVVENGKALIGSIPATRPDLSINTPNTPKISDSYKTDNQVMNPMVMPQGTGNKFQAIDQTQLENEVGGAQIVQDQPEKEESGFVGKLGGTVGNSLMAGTNSLNSWVAASPGFIYDLAGAPFRAVGLNVPTSQDFEDKPLLDIADYYKSNAKAYEQKVQQLNPSRGNGVIASFQNGDIEGGILNLAGGIAESAPASIAMMLSGGMTAPTILGGAVVFGAAKAQEMDENAPEMNYDKRRVISAINGTIEGIFETYLGSGAVGKSLAGIIKNQGKEVAQEQAKRSLSTVFADMITKNPWLAPLGEGFEEVGTQLAQNLVDKYSGYRPDISITEGVGDSFLSGVGMGGIHGAVIGLAKKAMAERNAQPITTATIEGQQFTVNNPEDLGIEGKPIFAKDAHGNVIAVAGKKKDLIADVVTQTQGELDQAQQAAADQQALMNGITDPNAQILKDETFDEGARVVDFNNGQSKIIYNGQEAIANDENEKDAILNNITDFQKLPEPKVTNVATNIKPVSTEPKTFNEQIPKKVVGKKEVTDYESVPAQTTVGALVEDFEDQAVVDELIDSKISDLEGQIVKIGKVKVIPDIDQYKQNLKEVKGKTDEVTKQLEYWKSVKLEAEQQKANKAQVDKEQKQADTDILLDALNEFNATPQSREDKQTASEIEAAAKKLGYQTERNAMNEIRLFYNSGTISKPIAEVKPLINEKPIEETPIPEPVIAEQGEDTPQAKQGERVNEGLEENVKVKKVEIENRRQEELGKTKDKVENTINALQKKKDDGTANVEELDGLASVKSYKKNYLNTELDKINAKYDAELLALENISTDRPATKSLTADPVADKPKAGRKPNTIIGKAKEIEVAESDIQGLALQYFINGGLVHPDEILRMFRNNKNERNFRNSYTDKDNGQTVAKIAHNIWEALPETIQDGLGEMDVYNAVESVITSHNNPTSMANELLGKYVIDPNQGYSKEWLDNQLKLEKQERQTELDIWVGELEQLEKNGQLPTENELIELFLPENTNNGKQEIDSTGSIDSHRPVNPEGNGEVGQNVQGGEPGVHGEVKEENGNEVVKPTLDNLLKEGKKEREEKKNDNLNEPNSDYIRTNENENEVNQPKRKYKTKEGETLQYDLFSDTVSDNRASEGDIQRQSSRVSNPVLRRLNEGEFSLVEQKYSLDKNFVFDGRNQIESTDDVAYLFKNLESKGIENMFACFVKDGKPTIVHISMGNTTSTLINSNVLSDGISRFAPDKVYLIHNHPSGNLLYSEADINMHQRAVDAFGDIIGEHIIINLKTGKYATFREGKNSHVILDRPQDKSVNTQKEYKVYSFDRQVFKNNTELPVKITSSGDIASFISSQRFSDGNKLSAIILDRGNNIKAYLHLPDVNFELGESINALKTELQGYVGRFGGSGVILSGTRNLNRVSNQGIRNLKNSLKNSDINLLDVISNFSTRWNYTSQADEGLLEPTSNYEVEGNNGVPLFRIIGETGAGNLDKAEEATTRLDNLKVAREMEQAGKDAKTIRLATGWEKGAENSLFAGRTTQEVLDYLESYNIIKKVPC